MPGNNIVNFVVLALTVLLLIQDHRYRSALDRIRELENEIERIKK